MNRVGLESGASHVPALQAGAFFREYYLGFRSMTRFTPGVSEYMQEFFFISLQNKVRASPL